MIQTCPGDQRFVIVADDDEDWRQLVTRALRGVGFQVVEAADGAELLARVRALVGAGAKRLIVVSDVEMPNLNGIHALQHIISYGFPVQGILVTGASSPSILAAAMHCGAHHILHKPVAVAALLRKVMELSGG